MRYTIVRGIDDGLELDLGTNVSIICAVMEIGRAIDAITFEVEISGDELLSFLKRFGLDEKYGQKIVKDNRYRVIAFDW